MVAPNLTRSERRSADWDQLNRVDAVRGARALHRFYSTGQHRSVEIGLNLRTALNRWD